MGQEYVVTGNLRGGRVVELDESLPVSDAKVRVRIEPLVRREVRPLNEVMAEIWREQAESGHVPPTREEVDAYLEAERASWD
jgi:hypothetical protein